MKQDKVVGSIYESMDYNKFKVLTGNRSVEKARTNRIEKSYKNVGLRNVPIIVNKNFEVVDGQGRLAVCKEKGLPVRYIFDNDAGVEECLALNMASSRWRQRDMIKSGADLGNADYVMLDKLLQEFNHLGVDCVAKVCSGGQGCNAATSQIQGGRFKMMRTEEDARARLKYIEEFMPKVTACHGHLQTMSSAINFAVDVCNADPQRLLTTFNRLDPFKNQGLSSTVEGCVALLERLYNHKLVDKNKIWFLQAWKQRSKLPSTGQQSVAAGQSVTITITPNP